MGRRKGQRRERIEADGYRVSTRLALLVPKVSEALWEPSAGPETLFPLARCIHAAGEAKAGANRRAKGNRISKQPDVPKRFGRVLFSCANSKGPKTPQAKRPGERTRPRVLDSAPSPNRRAHVDRQSYERVYAERRPVGGSPARHPPRFPSASSEGADRSTRGRVRSPGRVLRTLWLRPAALGSFVSIRGPTPQSSQAIGIRVSLCITV
jgi:hypothetical protein